MSQSSLKNRSSSGDMDVPSNGSLSPSKGKSLISPSASVVVSPQEINAQPQDFVVVNGQTFRVSRASPRSYSLGSSLDAGLVTGNSDDNTVTSSIQFKKQLDQADKIIMKQAKKIEELELLLRMNNIAIASPNTSQDTLANRRRTEARNIQINNMVDNDLSALGNTIKSPQKSNYITPTNAEIIREAKYSSFSAPNSTKNIDTPNIYDSPDGDDDNTTTSTASNSKEPPKGLAARLAMGSQERRKIAAAKRLKSLPKGTPTSIINDIGVTIDTSTPVALLRSNSSPSLNQVLFKWKGEQKGVLRRSLSSPTMNSMKNSIVPPFLFIAHDNPQLGSTVASQLAIDSSGMNIMLESKDDLGLTKFLLARIVFSGDVECVEDAELSAPRGSQFLVCHDIKAVKGDIKAFPTRVKGDILEIGLGNMPPDCYVDISSDGKLKEYLQTCTSRVDVILDPSGSEMWYPYFEGRRKMAPQFRSKGIGYIRLGDDMSRYGIAFLTLDAGHTYLDDGATSIVSPAITESARPTPTSITPSYGSSSNLALHHPNLLKGEKLQFVTDSESEYANSSATNNRSRSNSSIRTGSGSSSRRSSRPNSSNNLYQNIPAEVRSPREIEECKELITRLKDGSNAADGGALKWSDRAEYLKRLANNMAIKDSTYITDAISIAILSMTKQKNPHVVRAAVQLVKVIGESPYIHINNSVAWRSLLVETIQLLRGSSKPIYDDAVYVLTYLHSIGCFTIGSLTVILDDIFGSKKNSVSSASNSSKVISLLETLCRSEIEYNMRRVLEKSASPTNTDFVYDKIDSNNILQRIKHLLQHREEATRDTAVTLVAAILAYHIVNSIDDSSNAAQLQVLYNKLGDEQRLGRVNSSISLVVGKYFSANINNFLTDIDKTNPRLYEKIMVEFTSSFVSLMNAATTAGPLGNTSSTAGTVTSISSDILKESKGKRDHFSPLTIRELEHSAASPSAAKSKASIHHVDESDMYSLDELSNSWYELRLILRIIPNTEAGWRQLATCIKEAPEFFALLSSTAKKNNVAQGSLLRVVLPFDEETSSNDQAQVRSGLSPSVQKVAAGYQNIDEQTMSKLREQAIMLRKLIRVKMADEADLQQAILATRMLIKFCDDVDSISALANTKPVNIIKSLDTNSPLSSM
jgi:hypothetical protein